MTMTRFLARSTLVDVVHSSTNAGGVACGRLLRPD